MTAKVMDGDAVRAVVVTGKEGNGEFAGDLVDYATGDGDVAFNVGAEIVVGTQGGGRLMSISFVIAAGNADTERARAFVPDYSLAKGRWA